MRYLALASDYDDTLATHGQLADGTASALEDFRSTGRKVLLVTGRELDDLKAACDRLDLFDRVIAENGAVLYDPRRGTVTQLAQPLTSKLTDELTLEGVAPLSKGRVILATTKPFEPIVRRCIERLSLDVHVILNRGAVMMLPSGIDKASGLRRALIELDIPPSHLWAIGDAENDLVFLRTAGFPAAVANALPSVRSEAIFVSRREAGLGVEELIRRILHEDV